MYGLFMFDIGCLLDGIIDWKLGWIYYDIEDDNNEN